MAATLPKPRRRTQLERRETTRALLMEATLKCLARDGYAHTSISTIIAEAGVSRGALLHHFPTKNDLIAAVIDYFYRQRLERFRTRLLGTQGNEINLEHRLRVLLEDFCIWNDLALEIEGVLRTNTQVATKFEALTALNTEDMSSQYEQLFPEFEDVDSPRDVIGVTSYLMLGLARESGGYRVEKRFRICKSMLQSYLAAAKED